MRNSKSHLTSFDVIKKFRTASKQEVNRFGNNVEKDPQKIADVTNKQK